MHLLRSLPHLRAAATALPPLPTRPTTIRLLHTRIPPLIPRAATRPPPPRATARPFSSGSSSNSSSGPDFRTAWFVVKLLAVAAGGAVGVAYMTDSRATAWKQLVMPAIHMTMDPETAHVVSIWLAKFGLVPWETADPEAYKDVLGVELWGKQLFNPIGLAAGYDKHAEAIDALFNFGFGLVEVGSITPVPQPGNPKPRMFRLTEDRAAINRYGFNSEGHAAAEQRLRDRIRRFWYGVPEVDRVEGGRVGPPAEREREAYVLAPPAGTPRALRQGRLLGVNLGKNKVSAAESNEDYVKGVESLGPYADYVVVNISSPNTPGLRALQRREPMLKLLQEVKQARDKSLPHRPPLIVKIAPDLKDEELEDVAFVVQQAGIDGIIIGNTTISRPASIKSDPKIRREFGGLSGPPLLPLALSKVKQFYALTGGKVPIVGCGGIRSADDALAFARAGASVVQLYTGLSFDGPGVVAEIKEEVAKRLRKEGKTWSQVVGADHKKCCH
ncbi:Dihydroorotate dehydrogenase (quinone), mitochondrial [Phlyctochytrium bullatum]|nr:Dihydroorotate dehydrogenase (quinone), mitochondrial [Phlyctochytrium bullatum]